MADTKVVKDKAAAKAVRKPVAPKAPKASKPAAKSLPVLTVVAPVETPKAAVPAVKAKPVRKPSAVKAVVKPAVKPVPAAKPTPAVVATPAASAVAVPVASAPLAPIAAPAPKEKPMPTETYTKTIEAVVPAMEKAAADAAAQVQAGAEQMNVKMREMMEKSMKSMTEMTEFAKGNVEAMIESAKAAAAGAETLTTHFVETSKKSVEEAQAAFKSMTAAKTPNELIAAQNEFAKAQFDKAVANMSHFSETWMKLAGEVVQPLSNRVALATETVKKSMAA